MKNKSSKIYFKVFEKVSQNSEYFQPKEEHYSLPEVIVSIVTSTIFLAFFESIFQELGKNLVKYVKDKFFGKKTIPTIGEEEIMTLLNELETKKTPINIEKSKLHIEKRLLELGINDEKAKALTIEIITMIVKYLE